ncbi:MAG TPA: hypothetical protein VMD29_00340, partial [Terracidiphilus sp.]|nr:hypothetical protein [Terracidiphilus sp.]
LAWWSDLPGATQPATGSILAHGDQCLQQLAEASLDTDWGLRDVSNEEGIYDGMSYHQGSVWPLFTGWAALAEFRGGQPLAGYRMLMQNADLTWAQDLGADTELLSGDFYAPFGRSTSHQLWSSAMVITPTLRGLFGISIDAQTKTITVNPHLPADWSGADVRNLPLSGGPGQIHINQDSDGLRISMGGYPPSEWHLRSDLPGAQIHADKQSRSTVIVIPAPPLEVNLLFRQLDQNGSGLTPEQYAPPIPGARTQRYRVVREEYSDHKLVLSVEGKAGTTARLVLKRRAGILPKLIVGAAEATNSDRNEVTLTSDGGPYLSPDNSFPLLLTFHFPPAEDWKTITVTLTW